MEDTKTPKIPSFNKKKKKKKEGIWVFWHPPLGFN
jgi:hypothetical protein